MGTTTFSGPVVSNNGFTGAVSATTLAASGNVTLSGAANVIIIPTTDPAVAGAIWNNAGTLAVSAG